MEKDKIAIFAAVLVVLAVRLYQRYMKKKETVSGPDPKQRGGSSMNSVSDDYEPYSGK